MSQNATSAVPPKAEAKLPIIGDGYIIHKGLALSFGCALIGVALWGLLMVAFGLSAEPPTMASLSFIPVVFVVGLFTAVRGAIEMIQDALKSKQ